MVDQVTARREMQPRLLEVLEKGMFDYRIQEAGHFALGDKWFPVDPPCRVEDKQSLSFALKFPQNVERSWKVRVAGVSQQEF